MNRFRALCISVFCLGLAACFVPAAHAAPEQNIAYSWTVPTTRADGSALAVTELASYNIYYTVDGGVEQKVSVTLGGTAEKSVALSLAAKPTPYTIVSTISAIDTSGQESARSASVTSKITVLPPLPTSPGNFTLTIACANGSCTLVIQ